MYLVIFVALCVVASILILTWKKDKRQAVNLREEPVFGEEDGLELASAEEGVIVEDSANSAESSPLEDLQEDTHTRPVYPSRSRDFIALRLLAPNNSPYVGYELLQAILSTGFRYGKMNIFHRHEQLSGQGKILFSLASIAEPGTFDLPKMGAFSTPGLTIFMQFEPDTDLIHNFEMMHEAAQQLMNDLGGSLFDDDLQPLNADIVHTYRNKIKEYEANKTTADLFE